MLEFHIPDTVETKPAEKEADYLYQKYEEGYRDGERNGRLQAEIAMRVPVQVALFLLEAAYGDKLQELDSGKQYYLNELRLMAARK